MCPRYVPMMSLRFPQMLPRFPNCFTKMSPNSVHIFNQHLSGPYYTQIFHKAQPTHSNMAQMLVIMDVRYDICKICMRYVAYVGLRVVYGKLDVK